MGPHSSKAIWLQKDSMPWKKQDTPNAYLCDLSFSRLHGQLLLLLLDKFFNIFIQNRVYHSVSLKQLNISQLWHSYLNFNFFRTISFSSFPKSSSTLHPTSYIINLQIYKFTYSLLFSFLGIYSKWEKVNICYRVFEGLLSYPSWLNYRLARNLHTESQEEYRTNLNVEFDPERDNPQFKSTVSPWH